MIAPRDYGADDVNAYERQPCIECHRAPQRTGPFCGFRCASAYARGNAMDPSQFRQLRRDHEAGHIWLPGY